MSITRITDADREPVYYLKIEGLAALYGTVKPPDLTVGVGVPGNFVEYATRAAVIPGEGFDFSRRLVAEDAIIESEVLAVSLATDDESPDAFDPARIFGKLGQFGASYSANLRTDILPGAGDIVAEVSTTVGVEAGDVVHIGRETCYVVEVLAGPPRLSLTRGELGTREQAHRIDAESGIYPLVTSPLVHFRGRRVTIYESALRADGSAPGSTEYVERMKGVLVSEPQIAASGKGHSIDLQISPITGLLDQPLGTGSPTLRLSAHAHTFDAMTCNLIDIVEKVKAEGDLLSLFPCAEDPDGFNFIPIFAGGGNGESVMGAIGSFDGSLPAVHPRSVPLNISGSLVFVTDVAGNLVKTDPVVSSLLPNFDLSAKNEPSVERRRLAVSSLLGVPQTYRWPDILVQRFTESFGSESMDNTDGGRFRLALDLTSEVSPAITVSANFSWVQGMQKAPSVSLSLCNDVGELVSSTEDGFGDHRRAHIFNADGVDPDSRIDTTHQMIPYEVLELSSGEEGGVQTVDMSAELRGREIPPFYLATRVANAFCYLGHYSEAQERYISAEKYLTLATDPGIPVGESRSYEFTKDDESEPLALVNIGPAAAVNVDGVTVYRSEILNSEVFGETSVMADRSGEDPHKLQPIAAFEDKKIGEIILELLCSLDGGRITSAGYDVLPFGAAMDESDIDVESFLAIPDPIPGAQALRPKARQAGTIYEAVRGLLRASGYAIDLRLQDDGVCRVVATPIGIPNASKVAGSIGESEIADTPPPASTAELSIRNVFNFRSNFDPAGEAGVEKTVKDSASVELFGEASDLDVDLQGVDLRSGTPGQMIEALRPLFSRLRQEFSYPRRVFVVTLRAGLVAQMQIGGTYALSHRQLLGADGVSVDSALCRLRSISFSGFDAVAECEFVFYGFSGSGWGPSADVEIIAGNILTLSAASYSSAGDSDIDAFLVAGAKVRLYDASDVDAFQEVTVGSYDKALRKITLVEASVWPIDEPAYLTPTVYDLSPESLKLFGYFDKTRVT